MYCVFKVVYIGHWNIIIIYNYYHLYLLLQDAKDKKVVPTIQLNVIRLLAELNVQVNKPEVVDTILPLFIENLEEGDASTPGSLRLRV